MPGNEWCRRGVGGDSYPLYYVWQPGAIRVMCNKSYVIICNGNIWNQKFNVQPRKGSIDSRYKSLCGNNPVT